MLYNIKMDFIGNARVRRRPRLLIVMFCYITLKWQKNFLFYFALYNFPIIKSAY